ncbi:MAG: hypothetical protein O6945_10860, partial [Gammaproteobacteria bacterium]|nr:hypothetical protein [Gammaproteobacteria bacterium]
RRSVLASIIVPVLDSASRVSRFSIIGHSFYCVHAYCYLFPEIVRVSGKVTYLFQIDKYSIPTILFSHPLISQTIATSSESDPP